MRTADDFPKLPHEADADYLWRLLGDEKYLKAVSAEICAEAWAEGMPVWRADEHGIFNLHQDGTKEYLKED